MMIEDVIKKSILPLAFILFWFWIVSTIMKVSGKTDLFWWIFLSGLPFGIHKMRLILIPKGMDITATLGMAALSVIIGALIGSIMIPVYVIRKMEYMPVDCLQVPKMLFQVEEFKNLSNTAKILYSLFLDRLKFAVQNGWVDHNGDLFVIYPKSEMKKDLNTTRYGVDQAVQELVKIGKLVRIVQNDGKANHFYINDIYENEMEEESMMTLDRIMANMQMEEREIIMDKMVAASRDILGTIADMGYLNEYETPLTPMEERGYYDEEGNLDIDAVEADGYEFGMDLAFGVLSIYEGKPERVLEIQKYVNEQYECCSNKKFMKVLETIARMNGNEEVYIEDMYVCNKEARNYYLSELMMCFNFVFNEMCHGTGSAANCDFDVEE